jgi:hypothetical protein
MPNLTIRNIPEGMLDKLRRLSEIERRSLNSEIIVVLEKCLDEYKPEKSYDYIPVQAQVAMWEKLAGEWDDPRPAKEIAAEIIKHRTRGRKVDF